MSVANIASNIGTTTLTSTASAAVLSTSFGIGESVQLGGINVPAPIYVSALVGASTAMSSTVKNSIIPIMGEDNVNEQITTLMGPVSTGLGSRFSHGRNNCNSNNIPANRRCV